MNIICDYSVNYLSHINKLTRYDTSERPTYIERHSLTDIRKQILHKSGNPWRLLRGTKRII